MIGLRIVLVLAILTGGLTPAVAAARPAAATAAGPAAIAAAKPAAAVQENRAKSAAAIFPANATATGTSEVVRISLVLSLLALIPALVICMTPFVRIVIVLSMVRHAMGMPETPPNQALISLAIMLTVFVMSPTLGAINAQALQPFLNGAITVNEALDRGSGPISAFMLRQVRDQDIKAVYEMAKQPLPARAADVGLMQLTPAYMLNELRVSFKIGFIVFLPFLLIDLVVSSVLLSLGMLMVPPSTLALPIKVLMFVLIDGWSLVLQGVVGSIR